MPSCKVKRQLSCVCCQVGMGTTFSSHLLGHVQACQQPVGAYPTALHTHSRYSKHAPLHQAAAQGWPEAVKDLFTAGVNVTQRDVTNKTPLQLAIDCL